jgi:hypothetical protein
MADRVDRSIAAAEASLDRIDDAAADVASTNGHVTERTAGVDLTDGMHIEDDDQELEVAPAAAGLTTEEILLELDGGPDAELADCVEAFSEAFNARDLDSLITRGQLADECVAVMWELGDGGGWWRVATVHFADCVDGQMGVVEFSDDPGILDEVDTVTPDGDVDEGVRWEEWEEGTTDP